MHRQIRGSLLACLLFVGVGGSASAPASDPVGAHPMAMRFQGEREGLPHTTIHTLCYDLTGCLWVGTKDGLASFNGRAWKPLFLPPQTKSNYIRALACTPDGSLWVGTQDDGLWQWKAERWTHHRADDALPARRINHLYWAPSPKGYSLWVSTADAGVAKLEQGAWTRWTTQEGLPSNWVWRVRPGKDRVWICTFDGLASIQNRLLTAHLERHFEVNDVLDLQTQDGQGDVWLSCWNRGLLRLRNGRFNRPEAQPQFPSRHPISLALTSSPDGAQVMWVGTYDQGLYWQKGEGAWQLLDAHQGFLATGVYDLLPGAGGQPTLWVGSRGAGLGAIDLGGWSRIKPSTNRPDDRVQAFGESLEQGKTKYWFGTERGLMTWYEGRWSIFDAPGAFPSSYVNSFHETSIFGKRAMLIGTLRGLVLLEGAKARVIADQRVLPNTLINAIVERPEEGGRALWLATEGGLARYFKGAWSMLTTKQGLSDNWVNALLTGRSPEGIDELWVGTRGGGITCIKEGRCTEVGLSRGLPHPAVNALRLQQLPNGKRRLWAGTFGGGLSWWDPDDPHSRWQGLSVGTIPSLPSNVVLAMDLDERGRVYASTTKGVIRVDVKEGEPIQHWGLTTFTENEGLPSRIGQQAGLRIDTRGRVWVGTEGGMAVYDPRLESAEIPLRSPRIEALLASGKTLPLQVGVEVGPQSKNLMIRFDLPVYSRAADLRFQTQVVGLEDAPGPWVIEDWRELTGLGPGRYVFRVRARDHLGRITPFADLPFRILPPAWRSPWAYAGYALLALTALLIIHQLRVRLLRARTRALKTQVAAAVADLKAQSEVLATANEKLVALDALKNRMLGIVAHDLRNPIGAVMTYAELLTDPEMPKDEVVEVAEHVGQSARFMHELLRRFLDLEAIERGKMELTLQSVHPLPLLQRLVNQQRPRAEAKGLVLEAHLPENLPSFWADPVYLQEVLENLISNAIKFSPVNPPGKRVSLEAGEGWIAVADEGPGFTPQDREKVFGKFERLSARPTGGESSTGLGLAIVKSLAEQMGGTITLESEPGKGARFTLRLPLA
jgi:signal transduction histidine kinase/ligand-binding sensor domain-containing protein